MSRCHPIKSGGTQKPGPPTIQSAIAGDGRVTVTWSFPPAGIVPVTGYTVISSPGNITVNWSPGPLSVIVPGLTNGVAYTFTLVARNSVGDSIPSLPSKSVIPGTPGPPSIVMASASDKSATVTWPAVTGATSYSVTSNPGGITTTTSGLTATLNTLTNGTLYTFRVTARNTFGSGPSTQSNAVTPKGPPSAPIIGNITGTSISWLAPETGGSPITKYTVTTVPPSFTVTTSNLSASFTELSVGISYIFSITATNILGTGPAAISAPFTLSGVPGAPTNVVATLYDRYAIITWSPAAANSFPITSYTIDSIPAGYSITTRGNLSVTITGLINGTEYTFTVTAKNAAGTGLTSAPSNRIIPYDLPAAPTDIIAVMGNASASVFWTIPNDNGSPIIQYVVTSNPDFITVTTSQPIVTVTGLSNGTGYVFTVSAVNIRGPGPSSLPSNMVFPGSVPDAPTINTALANDATATISWYAPPNNGSTIIRYTVTSNPGNITVITTGLSATVRGLSNSVPYTFTVTATNANGIGPPSRPTDTIIPRGLPGIPIISSTTAGVGFVTLSWIAPPVTGSPILYYTVYSTPGRRVVTTTSLTQTISGLSNGVYYIFRVNATSAYGTGPFSTYSRPVLPAGAPGAPGNVVALSGNSNSLVTWSAPLSNGGFPITSYRVTSTPGNFSTIWTSGPLSAVVNGLTNGNSYTFNVTASNYIGTGLPSTSNSIFAGSPGPPRNLSSVASDGQASLVWTNPPGVSSPIQYYTVYITPNNGVVGTITKGADDGGTSSCVITGLTNGTTYYFIVSATNLLCTGPFSTASNTVIPISTATVPDAPTNVTAIAGNTIATLTWSLPSTGGSPITSYTITGGGTVGTITTNISTATCTISSLMNGLTYIFTINAVNIKGAGPTSVSNSIIPSGVPGSPTNVVAVLGNTEASLSWTNPPNNGQAILYYTVTVSPVAGTVGTITKGADGGGTSSCTITGLTNGTSYTFSVSAVNSTGPSQSTISNSIIPATLPGVPSNIVAIPYDTFVTLSWTNPSNNGNPFTRFNVTGGGTVGTITIGATTSSCFITGLTIGSTYTFSVSATTIIGTSLPGTSNSVTTIPAMILNFNGNPSITLPVSGGNVFVDFGNGSLVTDLSGTVRGPVKISGAFTSFGSSGWSGVTSLLSVTSWSFVTSLSNSFNGAIRLTSVPSTLPSSVTNTAFMFNGATVFNQNLSTWNVSNVLNMESMFSGATAFGANGLSSWTPIACTNMNSMFKGPSAAYTSGLFNTSLNNWPSTATNTLFFSPDGTTDTSITDPRSPFVPTSMVLNFTVGAAIQLPITGGTVYIDYGDGNKIYNLTGTVSGNGTVRIYGTFTSFGLSGAWYGAASLLSVSSWPSLTSLSNAFNGATRLTSVPSLPSSVTNTAFMFNGATAFTQNISTWNVSNVLNMESMFSGATAFGANGLSSWTPTACTNMNNMFRRTSAAYSGTTAAGRFNTNLTIWPSTAASSFFFSPDGTTDTTGIDISSPFTTLSMQLIFTGTPTITLPISGGNVKVDFGNGTKTSSLTGPVSGIVKVYGNFTTFGPSSGQWSGVSSLLSVSSWPSLTSLSNAFNGATSLTSVPTLSSSATDTSFMFNGATAFNQNLSTWNVSNVLNMESMFSGATAFTATGLSSWTPIACTNMNSMFKRTNAAYTNTSSTGTFTVSLITWPSTASRVLFFSPDGTTDTSTTDSRSPFTGVQMIMKFNGTPNITLPISGSNIFVDFGNGNPVSSFSGTVSGVVKVYGNFTTFGLSSGQWSGVSSLENVSLWPSLTSLSNAFNGATRLTSVPSTLPSSVTNTSFMFNGATLFNQTISSWNVSNVLNMDSMFSGATAFNALGLNNWTPTACTNMTNMFRATSAAYSNSKFNTILSSWPSTASSSFFFSPNGTTDTTLTDLNSPFVLTSMEMTFNGSSTITLPIFNTIGDVFVDFGNGVKSPSFSGAVSAAKPVKVYGNFAVFGGSSISNWSNGTLTSVIKWPASIQFLEYSFYNETEITSVPSVLPSSIISMSGVFYGATKFNQPISTWNVSNVTTMQSMFQNARAFNQNISSWNVSKVLYMNAMFSDAIAFTASGLNNWIPTACLNMSSMFQGTSAAYSNGLFTINLSDWPYSALSTRFFSPDGNSDTSSTDPFSPFIPPTMVLTFSGTPTITLPISGSTGTIKIDYGDGVKSTNLSNQPVKSSGTVKVFGTFTGFGSANWSGLTSLTGVSSWPSILINLSNAFNGATREITVPALPSSVTNTSFMFANTTSFNQNISNWNVSNVLNMDSMFFAATAFNAADLNSWAPTACTNMNNMFRRTTTAYSSGLFNVNIFNWPSRATSSFFFSSNGSTDTSTTDPYSPFVPTSMEMTFNGTPTIALPISGGTIFVDFGNGNKTSNLTGTVSGVVRVYGNFTTIGDGNISNWSNGTLKSVNKWPSTLVYLDYAFANEAQLTSVPSTLPSSVVSTSATFYGASSFNQNLSTWNVSKVTTMKSMFERASVFNQNISGWNVSKVNNMNTMFADAVAFTASGLTAWNPIACLNMINMFLRTSAAYTNGLFNTNLNTWPSTANSSFFFSADGTTDTTTIDTNSPFVAVSMQLTFSGTPTITLPISGGTGTIKADFGTGTKNTNLTGPVSGTVKVYGLFTTFGSANWSGVTSLTGVSSWPSTLVNLSNAFNGATRSFSVPALPSSVTNTSFMFANTTSFNQNLSSWNVTKVLNMDSMFFRATAFNATDLNSWTPAECTNMNNMFRQTTAAYSSGLFNVSLNNWPSRATSSFFFSPDGNSDTSTTDQRSPFILPTMVLNFISSTSITLPIGGPTSTITVDYGDGIKTNNLTGTVGSSRTVKVYGTFTVFGNQSVSNWSKGTLGSVSSWPSSIQFLEYSFYNESQLTSVPSILPSSIRHTSGAFYGATKFNQDISTWDVSNITTMQAMFQNARAFNQNISSWNVSKVFYLNTMFTDAVAFTATGLNNWTPTVCVNMSNMFQGTTAAYTGGLFNTNLRNWPNTAQRILFFSPNGTSDTTTSDPKSPFFGL